MLSSHLFDFGYRKITNIDISSVVIKQMKKKMGNQRLEMKFEQMDVLNMSYEKETFTVVLDKGTLDALMPGDSEADRERAKKLFSEVDRVLKSNGRYIIISLLQEHIVKAILDCFTEKGWMIRILRCWEVEKKFITSRGCLTMPVFMVVCVKFKKSKCSPILEANLFINGISKRVESKEELVEIIKGIQGTIFNFKEAKGEIEIKFCRTGEEKPRYTIYIIDESRDQRKLLNYAAFIVPHGRETEWMFGTEEGRRYLRNSVGFARLAVITFHRHQKYGSMEEVQDELRQTVLQLAPSFMPVTSDSSSIPYLTLGDGVGSRETVYSGTSNYSGDVLVEDVEIENEIFRRLVFMSNQSMIQSEVKMKKVAGNKKSIDSSFVASQHILYMSIPAAMKVSETSSASVAVIGVGGGSLCLLLRQTFPGLALTGVEIDPLVVELAEKYFGLEVDGERLKIVVKDGVEFLKEKHDFDVIMLDVDRKEPGFALSCPPVEFVDSSTLQAVAESLGETGIFVTNVVTRVDQEHEKLIGKIRKHFSLIAWYSLKEDVNRIVFASNRKGKSNSRWRQEIKKSASNLKKALEEKLELKSDSMDLDHLMNHLTI